MRSLLAQLFLFDIVAAINTPNIPMPGCPDGVIIDEFSPVGGALEFPYTVISVCYTDEEIQLNLMASNETYFYFNETLGDNGPIYDHEVMEAFIALDRSPSNTSSFGNHPTTYLEVGIAPNTVSHTAMIYNPSLPIGDPKSNGFTTYASMNQTMQSWYGLVHVPLALFNVDTGSANGTLWRMNFFRTFGGPAGPQLLGAWSPPDTNNTHQTPFFGRVIFQ